MTLVQNVRCKIDDDRHKTCRGSGAAGDAVDQLRREALGRKLCQCGVQNGAQQLQVGLADVQRQLDELIFHRFIRCHDDQNETSVIRRENFKAPHLHAFGM